MKLAKFKKMPTTVPNGIQVVLDFEKYHLSIIQSDFSYGGTKGLYEIGVFSAQDGVASSMINLPGITSENDSVKGFLTEADVDAIIKKMYTITGKEPVQV
jgi:hypothetical protein